MFIKLVGVICVWPAQKSELYKRSQKTVNWTKIKNVNSSNQTADKLRGKQRKEKPYAIKQNVGLAFNPPVTLGSIWPHSMFKLNMLSAKLAHCIVHNIKST